MCSGDRGGEGSAMKAERAWVRLDSGRRLNLLDPDPMSWTHRDLAIGLARTYRWGGHSSWSRPLSVAQHSVLVLALRQRSSIDRPLDRGEALRELLHDADEGMLSFDPIAPIKPHLGSDYQNLVDRLRDALALRYGLMAWDPDSYAAHKRADRLAASSEALHIGRLGYGRAQRDTRNRDPANVGRPTRPATRIPRLGTLVRRRCRGSLLEDAGKPDQPG